MFGFRSVALLCRTRLRGYLSLLFAVAISSLATEGTTAVAESEKTDLPKTIVGYGDQMTVRPGETIKFKVGTYAAGPYEAELLRLIIVDTLSAMPLYEVEKIPAPFAGRYEGRPQATYPGSYVQIDDVQGLNGLESFTVVALIKASTPNKGEQHIVSRWNAETRRGWSLGISERGESAVWVGDGRGHVLELESSRHVFSGFWTFVMVRYDAGSGKIRMYDEHLTDEQFVGGDDPLHYVFSDERTLRGWHPVQAGPLRFGAALGGSDGRGGRAPAGLYNGRIDGVRMARAALSYEDGRRLALSKEIPADLAGVVVGYWDFANGIGTDVVHDLSPASLNGTTVNMPMRAMMGQSWTGKVDDWKTAPDQYSAIYFHEDDLTDANWDTDFSYTVPADLDSAIYAVRVAHGDSEHFMPFFVAPPRGTTQAKVALLLPTMTYLAYSNFTKHQTQNERYPSMYVNKTNMAFLLDHDEFGRSTYDQHTDGTAVAISSWRRPSLTVQPKSWTNNNLVPDTEIVHWLETIGVDYDIITDDLLHAEGSPLLEQYRVVLTGQHPEYASTAMLAAITSYLEKGGRIMYLGANGYFRTAAWHPGGRDIIEVRRPYSWTTPLFEKGEAFLEFDGHLADRPGEGRNPDPATWKSWIATNLGVQMAGMSWGGGTYYRLLEDAKNPRAAFILKGVKSDIVGDYGSHFGGAAGEEVDRYHPKHGAPSHALELARSENHPEPVFGPPDDVRASLVFFETPSGGAVFSVGSMAYVGALRHNEYDNDIARITTNVLRRFLDPMMFEMPKKALEDVR